MSAHLNPSSRKSVKNKLPDAERHKRFVKMASELGVSETADVSDSVIKSIVKAINSKRPP